jgi:filamentous hemagglutinin
MAIDANTLTNTRRVLTVSTTYTEAVDPGLLSGLGISMSGTVGQRDVPDPDSIGGVYIEPPRGGGDNSVYLNTTYSGVARSNALLAISPEAQMIAGGNLTPQVDVLQNYWSSVAAGGNIALSGLLDQDSWRDNLPLQVQVVYSGTYNYLQYKGKRWSHSFCLFGCDAGADIRTYALPSYESSLTAGATISDGNAINAGSGNTGDDLSVASVAAGNGSRNVGGLDTRTGSGNGVSINNVSGNSALPQLGVAAGQALDGTTNPVIAAATAGNVLNNLAVPQGGLFHANAAPDARYLIETNPAFTNRQQWMSSDFYFAQLGLNPEQILKRLGDGFYEQRLVQEQILSLTGKSVLAGYADTDAEYLALLTAGANLARGLQLAPGIGLSAEQVAALTENVVIMQTQMVDGQAVLVPVVYLFEAGARNEIGRAHV